MTFSQLAYWKGEVGELWAEVRVLNFPGIREEWSDVVCLGVLHLLQGLRALTCFWTFYPTFRRAEASRLFSPVLWERRDERSDLYLLTALSLQRETTMKSDNANAHCRAKECTNPVRYLNLCERHYHRAHRAGLRADEINLLTPEQITAQFGSGNILPSGKPRAEATALPSVVESMEEKLAKSNVRLAAALKIEQAKTKELERETGIERGNVAGVQKLLQTAQAGNRELQTSNENLAAQVLRLNQDLESLLSAPAPTTVLLTSPALVHGDLVVTQVDLDASSRIRVTLRGEGCRDVAHLVGRKIQVSRLDPQDG